MIKATQLGTAAMAVLLCAGGAASEEVVYRYDARGRLVLVERPTDSTAPKTSYRIDHADNRVGRWTGTGTPPGGPPAPPPPPIPAAPPPPAFSVSDTVGNEGEIFEFTVTKIGETDATYSVGYRTGDGTATAPTEISPGDYYGQTGTLTFGPSQQILRIRIGTNDDRIYEAAEEFGIYLQNPSGGAGLAKTYGKATVNASDLDQQSGPPVTSPDAVSMKRCGNRVIDVVGNDDDPEGHEPLELGSVTDGRLGSASRENGTSVRYQGYGSAGTDSVIYTVRDTLGATASGFLTVTLTDGFCPVEN